MDRDDLSFISEGGPQLRDPMLENRIFRPLDAF